MKRNILAGLATLAIVCAGVATWVGWTQSRLERSLSELLGIAVRIERLTVWPWNLTLHRVSLGPLTVERLTIQKSWRRKLQFIALKDLTFLVGGIPLQANGSVFLSAAPGAEAECRGELTLEHPFLSGTVEVMGKVADPILMGWIAPPHQGRRHFVASFHLDSGSVRLVQMEVQPDWKVQGNLSWREKSSPLEGEAVLRLSREGFFQEIPFSWRLKAGALEVEGHLFERRILFQGKVQGQISFSVEIVAVFEGVETAEMARRLLPGSRPPSFSGPVFGQVSVAGPVNRLASHGTLSIPGGTFGLEKFSSMEVRFQGIGPNLQVENSRMVKVGGAVLIEGMVDLRRLGKPDFFSKVKLSPTQKSFAWGAWTMDPLPGRDVSQVAKERF